MNLNEFKVKLNEIIDNNRIIEDQARAKDYSKDYQRRKATSVRSLNDETEVALRSLYYA